jgi:hypothetical protein
MGGHAMAYSHPTLSEQETLVMQAKARLRAGRREDVIEAVLQLSEWLSPEEFDWETRVAFDRSPMCARGWIAEGMDRVLKRLERKVDLG